MPGTAYCRAGRSRRSLGRWPRASVFVREQTPRPTTNRCESFDLTYTQHLRCDAATPALQNSSTTYRPDQNSAKLNRPSERRLDEAITLLRWNVNFSSTNCSSR